MECVFFMCKCMQTRRDGFVSNCFLGELYVFASTFEYVASRCLLTGAIGIAMEYMIFNGRCMLTRRNDFCFLENQTKNV